MENKNIKEKVERWEAIIAELHNIILNDCYEKLAKPLARRVHLLENRLENLSVSSAKKELQEFRKFLQHIKDWKEENQDDNQQ